jgi:hypothetical protein
MLVLNIGGHAAACGLTLPGVTQVALAIAIASVAAKDSTASLPVRSLRGPGSRRRSVDSDGLAARLGDDRERTEGRAREDWEGLLEQIARVEERAREERELLLEQIAGGARKRRAPRSRATSKRGRRAAEERATVRSDAEDVRAAAAAAASAQRQQRMTAAAAVITLLALFALIIYALAPPRLAKAWIVGGAMVAFLGSLAKLLGVFGCSFHKKQCRAHPGMSSHTISALASCSPTTCHSVNDSVTRMGHACADPKEKYDWSVVPD